MGSDAYRSAALEAPAGHAPGAAGMVEDLPGFIPQVLRFDCRAASWSISVSVPAAMRVRWADKLELQDFGKCRGDAARQA
jgi:hypothetical protein